MRVLVINKNERLNCGKCDEMGELTLELTGALMGSEGAVACFMWLLVQIEANGWSWGVLAINEIHEFFHRGWTCDSDGASASYSYGLVLLRALFAVALSI